MRTALAAYSDALFYKRALRLIHEDDLYNVVRQWRDSVAVIYLLSVLSTSRQDWGLFICSLAQDRVNHWFPKGKTLNTAHLLLKSAKRCVIGKKSIESPISWMDRALKYKEFLETNGTNNLMAVNVVSAAYHAASYVVSGDPAQAAHVAEYVLLSSDVLLGAIEIQAMFSANYQIHGDRK